MIFLTVKNLSKTFGKKLILKSISFELNSGEVVALLGPNGAGKTTLLRTIIGLLKTPKYDSDLNNIWLENQLINKWPIFKRVENGLLYLPQQTSLFREMTVLDNLKLVYEYHNYWADNFKLKKNRWKIFEEEMDRWLAKTDLTSCKKQLAGNLSGGQKRKLEVVRSILMHPKGIMLDEPFAGVDPKSIYELRKIFVDMAEKNNIAVLISDHNVEQLLSIATRIYVVIDGCVVTSGGVEDIVNHNFTKEMYLGKQFYSEFLKKDL
ncbi:ATP-binding cassette domain-containing protein [Candidatus Dependentiae bacterium]|nr:ATP-binding cassette domain-containing protein [Candidatus Dependentiae bacterium]